VDAVVSECAGGTSVTSPLAVVDVAEDGAPDVTGDDTTTGAPTPTRSAFGAAATTPVGVEEKSGRPETAMPAVGVPGGDPVVCWGLPRE